MIMTKMYDYDAVISKFRSFPEGEKFIAESSAYIDIDRLIEITGSFPVTPVKNIQDIDNIRKSINVTTRVSFRIGDLFAPHFLAYAYLHNIYLLDYIEDVYPAVQGDDPRFHGVPVTSPKFSVPTSDNASFYQIDEAEFNPDTIIIGGIFGGLLRKHYNKVKILTSKFFTIDYSKPEVLIKQYKPEGIKSKGINPSD